MCVWLLRVSHTPHPHPSSPSPPCPATPPPFSWYSALSYVVFNLRLLLLSLSHSLHRYIFFFKKKKYSLKPPATQTNTNARGKRSYPPHTPHPSPPSILDRKKRHTPLCSHPTNFSPMFLLLSFPSHKPIMAKKKQQGMALHLDFNPTLQKNAAQTRTTPPPPPNFTIQYCRGLKNLMVRHSAPPHPTPPLFPFTRVSASRVLFVCVCLCAVYFYSGGGVGGWEGFITRQT